MHRAPAHAIAVENGSRSRFARRAILTCLATLTLFLSNLAADAGLGEARSCNYQTGLTAYNSVSALPGSCWRPYADSSPFNRRIGKRSPLQPGSRAIVRRMVSAAPAGQIVAGDPVRDGGTPIYFADPGDPQFTLRCTKDWGTCPIEGMKVNVPNEAMPAGGFATEGYDHDAHMTIIDPSKQWEYDLWHTESKPSGGGELKFGWGSRVALNGTGLGGQARAAQFGNLGGVIRAAELRAGQIDHALTIVVPCTDTFVYPAQRTGLSCAEAGLPSANAVPMGAHFQLNMSPKRIKRLKAPRWKKAILRALRRYGAYASDTTGHANEWGFEVESGASYTSFGLPDPLATYGKQIGLHPEDYNGNGTQEYWFDLASKVKWSKLRIVSPCVAQASC
jgi:hypothetical protein